MKKVSGDVFGRIYEYFLTQFAGQGAHDGGEFFTPVSLVSLIAHVLDPERGTVLDPACGSGGMFVQSARIVDEHGQIEAMGGGATMPNVNKIKFPLIPVVIPPPMLLKESEGFAKTSFQKMQILYEQVSHLPRARDHLLPRLMNGGLTA